MKIRNERFFQVPLCQTECNAWWEDCKDELTCVEVWTREFDWSTGGYTLSRLLLCIKFTTCTRKLHLLYVPLTTGAHTGNSTWKTRNRERTLEPRSPNLPLKVIC